MTRNRHPDTLPSNMNTTIRHCIPRGGAISRASTAIFLLVIASGTAFAQTGSAPAESARSMWSIIAEGMEWPAYLILVGSVATIALIVEHFVTIRSQTINPPQQVNQTRNMIERRAFRECLDASKKSNTFFARVLTASLQHARHGFDAMHEAAVEKAGELSGQMFRKVEYLNILGNLGPLMGLLGTVYGMIVAFHVLGASGGSAGADAGGLARGISLALVNTLLGLGLAVIGLLFFGICRNRVDALTVRATVQVLDLLEYFRPIPTASAQPSEQKAAAV